MIVAVLALCFIYSCFQGALAQQYELVVLTKPDGCIGGESCAIQPMVAVTYRSTSDIVYSFQGSVFVQIGSSPTGYDKLYYGNPCTFDSCGTEVVGSLVSVPFSNGMATFQKLYLSKAGVGYTLKFTGRDSLGKEFASTTSAEFSVAVGAKYKLSFFNFSGNAFGGEVFADNPVVSVVDRGGNLVDNVNQGVVTVSLSESPTGAELLRPTNLLAVPIKKGIAQFKNLFIKEAGFPYKLQFSCTQCGGLPSISTSLFHVAVGNPAILTIEDGADPSDNPIYGGEFFGVPPALIIRDAGGNRILRDNSSAVEVKIDDNPFRATIGPPERLFVVALRGKVQFTQLHMDKLGYGYTFRFILHTYSKDEGKFSMTEISIKSKRFSVLLGPARKLVLHRPAGGAWAGQQGFWTQPQLFLTDYGNNVVSSDFSAEVTMKLVTSLAVDKQIVIDTSSAPQTLFSAVATNWDFNASYGVGEELIITLSCPYHISVTPSSSGKMPYLLLNINNTDPSTVALAHIFRGYFQTRQLQFIYIVQPGDDADGFSNILLPDSLNLNGSEIIDGNKSPVDTTIPDHDSHFIIQSSAPVITDFACNTTSGEYGAGQLIRFSVSFDQPVAVQGSPYLILTANSSYDVDNNGTISTIFVPAIANFSDISDDGLDVFFDYLVLDGEYSYANLTLASPSIMFYNLTINTTVVETVNYTMGNDTVQTYSYPYDWVTIGETWIRRRSTFPTLDVIGSFPTPVLTSYSDFGLVIDTSRPKLDVTYGVHTNMSDGVYYPGDKIWLTVKYDKPIAWYGVSLLLRLFTGPSTSAGSAFVQTLLDDQMTLEFLYVVRAGDNVARLDISSEYFALDIVANESYVRRLSTFPTTEAEFVTAVIHGGSTSLRDTAALAINGLPLTPLSVALRTIPDNVTQLFPDDSILLTVTFDGPVIASCAPVFVLSLNYYREAVYVSGNNTNELVFMYNVSIGDDSSIIGYRSVPTALCATSRCPRRTSCSILSASDSPSLEIDYRLPGWNLQSPVITLSNITIVPTTSLRNTTIHKVSFAQDPGEYGAGSVLEIIVHFYDIVVVLGTDHPRLLLNIGEYADYVRGSYDDKLVFRYIAAEDDMLTSTDLQVQAISGQTTAIHCAGTCSIVNQADQDVDLSMDASTLATSSGIFIDSSSPVVADVYFEFENSRSVYTAGDLIKLVVISSKPVIVGGVNPRIQLDLRPGNPSAVYSAQLSSSTKLVFTYRSRITEKTTNLSYISREINMMDDFSVILRLSSIPVTPMNVSLPSPIRTPVISQSVDIDSTAIPVVLHVTCRNSSGTYAVGDVLVLEVRFSLDVVAMGRSRIALNMGDHAAYAYYAGYVPLNCTLCSEDWLPTDYNSSSPATRTLLYQYVVGVNDTTEKLEYIDSASYELLLTANNDPSYIKRVNHPVAISTDLTLPLPGSRGSISFANSEIQVDGREPRVISLGFLNPSGVYSVNSSILIEIEFSSAVVVYDGVPSILLETGAIKNEAFFVDGSGTNKLLFEYIPEPGDFNLYLDYYASRTAVNEAWPSFLYNGASILTASQSPSQDVHIFLNPPGGFLKGDVTAISDAGVVLYNDTYITRKGLAYELVYDAVIEDRPQSLLNSQSIYVSFSSEYQLRPEAALKEERIGHAVALQGDIAIMGAPDFNRSVTTVQVVEISVEDGPPRREVQTVQTNVNPQPAIQTFYTTAGIDQAVGGYFTVSFGIYGPSQPIASNADASTLLAILGYDMAVLGAIEVSRTRYDYCACENAYSWTITFSDYSVGTMNLISVDGSLLTGVGAKISQPVMLQSPSLIAGSFRLSALGRKSNLIPFDASASLMKSSIEQTGLSVHAITLSPTLKDRTRSWSVTFDAYGDSYEVPLLTTDASALSGGPGVSVSVTTALPGRHGPKGIAGFFQLQWRGNTTTALPPNATAAEVKAALEALPIINTVHVYRTLLQPIGAYSWTIDFLSVNYHTSRGYYREEISNLEPIVPLNSLIATNAVINVDAKWEIGSGNSITSKARLGTFGEGAGAVFVYQRLNDSWVEIATLRGNDTSINNKFGTSVSLAHDVLAIGAVGANRNGLPEKQSLRCSAHDGYFYVSFRGWRSGLIGCNATREELLDAIISPSGGFDKVHAITALEIDDWGGGPVCANQTAVLTFFGPIDGAANLFGIDTGPNLELLTLTNHNLTSWDGNNVTLEAAELQRGTWVLHGTKADPQQVGAVYVFRLHNNCTVVNQTRCLKDQWLQEAQFFPPLGASSTDYGFSVVLEDNVLVVGAPGSTDNSGLVYIYEYIEADRAWRYLQVLKDPANDRGSRFGHSVSKSGTTIVVTSSNLFTQTGEVYVYIRSTATGPFIATQFITAGAFSAAGSLFGADAAVLGNVVVVGVPGFNSSSVYLGDTPGSAPRSRSGAVLVFQRTGVTSNYLLRQVLTPSNVGQFTNFGAKVAVDIDVVIASSLEDYTGALMPSKPVISVKTKAAYNVQPLGGSFRLLFGKANSSDGMSPALFSRYIPHNALDVDLKHILEEDFPVGELVVTRSRVDPYDGGYEWLVTFMRYPYEVSLFGVDTATLSGTNASVEVNWVNGNPVKLRSNVHYFERTSSSSNYVEQVYLHPYKHQHMDLCGFDLAISGQYALVGCPNRDQDYTYRHSGVGFIYDLSLLSLKFSRHSFAIQEGDNAVFPVEKDSLAPTTTNDDVSYYALTLDRNADNDMQMFISNLFSVANTSLWLGRETILDHTELVGKAFARRQFYGSSQEEHRWVDGRYDYRAISDYVPKLESFTNLFEDVNVKDFVVTTNPDTLVELPPEQFTSVVMTPGLWPSILGKLVSHAQLDDHSTGLRLREERFAKVTNTENDANLGGVGTASALSQECGYMFVSSGMNNQEMLPQKGRVLQYFQNNGTWTYIRTFSSPSDSALGGVRFGHSLAVSCRLKRRVSTLLIGEPSINRVYRYVSTGSNFGNKQFQLDAIITVPEAHLESHRFGYSLAIDNEISIIGAPGLEAIYVYKQIYDTSIGKWTWSSATVYRSSDYDYDIVTNGQVLVHRQDFGRSVSISGRTIVVGAPFADYQNLGRTDVVENYDSEGVSIRSIAKGKVYMYYSAPSVDRLCLNAQQVLSKGQFRLIYEAFGSNTTTTYLSFNSSSTDVNNALDALENLDEVTVTRSEQYFNVPVGTSSYGAYEYCWTVTYHTPFTSSGRLLVEWFDTGCTNCTSFDYDAAADSATQFSLVSLSTLEEIHEVNTFSARDGIHGDRFGWSVAIDDNQFVVGAPYSSSLTWTSWDFEAGELLGWSRTGNAFDFQPTYGDNAKYRASYGQHDTLRSQFKTTSSGVRGKYYISTFDKHPDEESFPAGSVQGVVPTGTLSSDVFLVLGDKISFLIGGGCDIYRVYVELFIDGFSVAKVTGRCSETMLPASFDVSRYRNRAAQLRVVDNSTDAWGFITVDDFHFDWAVDGAVIKSKAGTQHGGRTEAIMSGAAYLYHRIADDMLPCSKALESRCQWVFERKLLPSDKREKAQFGYQVAVIDKYGLVAVSAPFAQLMMSYKDTPTAHPYILSFVGESSGAGLQYPVQPHNMTRFLSTSSAIPQASGSSGVWQLMKEEGINPQIIANSGAVYIYAKPYDKLGYTGQKTLNASSFNTETARIQPADLEGGDAFGTSLTSSKELGAIFIGAPGFSKLSIDKGAAYYYKLEFAAVRFEQVNFVVKEGAQAVVSITLLRDLDIFPGRVVLEYATNDLTARGVDSNKFRACLEAPTASRAALGCGDYEQTAGLMVIEPGVTTGGFTVNIMDDYCYEVDMKFIQLTLSVPGSSALQGEQYQAMIRIDDDDFGSDEVCTRTIQ